MTNDKGAYTHCVIPAFMFQYNVQSFFRDLHTVTQSCFCLQLLRTLRSQLTVSLLFRSIEACLYENVILYDKGSLIKIVRIERFSKHFGNSDGKYNFEARVTKRECAFPREREKERQRKRERERLSFERKVICIHGTRAFYAGCESASVYSFQCLRISISQ